MKISNLKRAAYLALLLSSAYIQAQINVPDPVFLSKLMESETTNSIAQDNIGNNIKIDANSDGQISIAEALNVYGLDISNPYNSTGPYITSMAGIDNFPNLRSLKCAHHQIPSLDLSFVSALWTLDCSYNELTSLTVSNVVQLQNLNCSYNDITSLDVSMLPMLNQLNFTVNQLTTIDVSSNTALQSLNVGGNQLTSLNISTLTGLNQLDASANQIGSIDLSGNPNLTNLSIRDNLLTGIDLNPSPIMTSLDIGGNDLAAIDISMLTLLENFSCERNQISSLDFTGLSQLQLVLVNENLLTALDLSPTPLLFFLNCEDNQITSLDLTPTPLLGGLLCANNLLTTIDGSMCQLINLNCNDNPIETIILKNGWITGPAQNIDFSNLPNFVYLCVDEQEQSLFQEKLVQYGYTDCVLNTYCSFTPGGNYNTIAGTVTFDSNGNGCDDIDPKQSNFKLMIDDGTNTGASFTNHEGEYHFYTQTGSFTVSPAVENPSFFNFTPIGSETVFADNQNNVSGDDFCVTANGVHPDVEIVIAPLTRARPGFDAQYLIVYKNKGNQTLSGNFSFSYDDTVLDLISVTETPNIQTAGLLQWNYTNLLPFEMRGITVTLNVNSPMETPPVDLDDILTYTVNINPVAGDELPADNQFTFNQTVVNAFDPNDITCLEGESVDPANIGNYLHYVVNFENLGNSEAENVVVSIDIDPTLYNINSLQLMSTSHLGYSRVTGNRIEFIFENILLDAAQGNPPVGGHGNVLFKIRSNHALETGDAVHKMANIFFDYNFPIATNDAETVFQSLKTPDFTEDSSVMVYPNPSDGILSVKSETSILSLELFDIHGRLLQTSLNVSALDISDRASGMYFLRVKTLKGSAVKKISRK